MFFARWAGGNLRGVLAAALLLDALASPLPAYTPGTGSPSATGGFVVNRADRRDVLVFFNCAYSASQNFAANMAWTGNVTTGVPGTTGAAFKDDVLRRINFYRAMGGLPADIVFDATKSAKCQEAALMFSANDNISHFPPNTWTWYTANAAEAAGNSNIALGDHGPDAVDAFMVDPGSGNELVGHRRWLLYPLAQQMATGDIPFHTDGSGTHNSANAIWVIGNFKASATAQFVPWPNAGFIPQSVVPARWSLSYPGAGFGSATVTMTQGATSVPVTVISRTQTGVGDNTIVWTPTGVPSTVTSDLPYTITVSGITGAGVPASSTYTSTIFNPDILGDAVTITGTATPPTTGQSYTFNSITQADQYELKVNTGSAAAWTEGAEDSPTPQITDQTTGGYGLRQTSIKRTGAKAFHLAFPSFTDQSFAVSRDVLASATSQLQWYDLGRFASTTTTLEAQVSTDNGGSWTSVFSRPGVGLSSALWDANFISRSISLAAYAGQIIQVRFILKQNGDLIVLSTSSNDGFFIDDITVTNATELVSPVTTSLASSATNFTLNAATAGAPLVNGTSYFMRIRPNVGTRWYGFGALKTVTAQTPTGYSGWVATQYPSVTGGVTGDHEADGIRNGVEYAFNLNPTVFNSPSSLPQPVISGGNMTISYTQPAGITGVTYGAEWSTDLSTWNPVTDTGSGSTHTFAVSTSGKPRLFMRHRIVVTP